MIMNVKDNINGPSTNQQQYKIDPAMKIGHVSLNVSDLSQSLDFYQSVLGFRRISRASSGKALLSVGSNDSSYLVELLQVKIGANNDGPSQMDSSTRRGRAGLYHFAILLPERKFLADMLQNLNDKRDQIHFDGLADHLVSESIYIRDPDFNGVEIYRDRPRSQWRWNDTQVEMATLPLNTINLLKETTEKGWKEMPDKTRIGHVHLHVSDIAKAMKFYREILGLQLTAAIPSASFFAVGGYHHHIATNTWLGTGIAPASSESIGLNHFSIKLSSKEDIETLIEQFSRRNMPAIRGDLSDRSVFVRDM
ncbi:MAG: VOC family protein, partial [Thermoproteota archaeon]|nr:VOC family protein [Thermoproteota archaeon]